MTESDWLSATDPAPLLHYLYPIRGFDSVLDQTRQSRLYLLTLAKKAWDRLPGVCQAIVSLAERVYESKHADRELKKIVLSLAEELVTCRGKASEVNLIGRRLVEMNQAVAESVWVSRDFDPSLWIGYSHLAYLPLARKSPHIGHIPSDLHTAELIREVFGNPLARFPDFDPAWRTENVVQLAQNALKTGDFTTLPILADALQEASCDRDDMLDHLRHGGPHVRGCWVLDLVIE